jgi:hypothetical protein
VKFTPTGPRAFVADAKALQIEVDNTLGTLGFLPLPVGHRQPTGFVEGWMRDTEGLSCSDRVAEWFRENRSLWWGQRDYSVEMFVQHNAIILVILTDENGSQPEVRKVQTILTNVVENKFPNLKAHVVFRRLITAMRP